MVSHSKTILLALLINGFAIRNRVARYVIKSGLILAHTKRGELSFASLKLAEWTGLEPATPGVTGRYSNQLNYHS
jgi:hypothetical protein